MDWAATLGVSEGKYVSDVGAGKKGGAKRGKKGAKEKDISSRVSCTCSTCASL
jgi:hypothetical protein